MRKDCDLFEPIDLIIDPILHPLEPVEVSQNIDLDKAKRLKNELVVLIHEN